MSCVERASARTGEVCPSEFGRLAAAIDKAESKGGDRIGGPSDEDVAAVRLLELRLGYLRPVGADDWRWLAGRMARAIENEWEEGAARRLAFIARG